MRYNYRHCWRLSIVAVLSACIGIGVLAFWSGSEIASPKRRPLMDYHRDFLTSQSAHGIRIEPFTTSDGTPCLMVTPDGNPGERGGIIRQQIGARGITHPRFGMISGTLVLTHGRKGRKEDYLPIAERLCAVGFRCLIPDLPGHGDHPSAIATYGVGEAGLPARVLDEASRKFGFEPRPAGLMGMSMGGSVAVHAADQTDAPWKALVVVASFDSFPSVINGQAVRYSGVALGSVWADATDSVYHWKSGIRMKDIQPARRAASIRIPTLIAHGTADRVISIDGGRRLFDSLPADISKKWIEIPGAGHDNVLVTDYPIYADIVEWMLRNVSGS
jgi:pimeloyl-ACP methyl ester carboxylesterase